MRIDNVNVYNLAEALVASGYAMIPEYDPHKVAVEVFDVKVCSEDTKHYKRGKVLGNTEKSSGHGNYLTGILVTADITATNKFWIEWQRYHFQHIVTGTSTMHKISKFDLDKCFNEYTDTVIIDRLKQIQAKYNEKPTPENYLRLLYSTPSGLEMTNHVTLNYMQLANMYNQRKSHRLPEWREEFCKWCLTLPHFTELTGCK